MDKVVRVKPAWRTVRLGLNASSPLLDFLIPAISSSTSSRQFSTTKRCKSRVGSAILTVPTEVHIAVHDPLPPNPNILSRTPPPKSIHVEGPLGKLSVPLPAYMDLDHDQERRKVKLSVADRHIRKQREMWGTTRSYINNHIIGVTEGHSAILRLVGVGYRATIEPSAVTKKPGYPGQLFVSLKVGLNHPVELPVPLGVKASTPQPTRILLEGSDKEVVNEFAAKIRKWRVPEPYKGKGIFVNGETIKLKAKKIK